MSKDTFWFRHDYDAADDEKTMILIEQLGLEGYGIYWVLIEKLRAREDYKMPFSIVPSLARRYMTTPEKMKTVIMNYGLFQYDDEGFFYSESLIRRMECYLELKEKQALKAKKAAEKRWERNKSMLGACLEHAWSNPQALQEQCVSNTHAMQSNADNNRIDNNRIDKNIEEYKEKEEEINSSSKKKKKNFSEFVERMYSLYPSKCPVRNTILGKNYKDKEKIQKLLDFYTEEEIEKVILHEVEEKYNKHYMQNFSTFLNNFPDPNCISASDLFSCVQEEKNELVINGQIYR